MKELDTANTEKLLGDLKIPQAPAVLMEIHGLLQQDEPELSAIADAVSKDVGMSALVLRTLNSPFFGLRNKVSSIRQATSLLGLSNITNIVAGLALRRAMEESPGPNPANFWDSPANVALVSAKLAERYPGVLPDEAYLIGLFENCGEALLLQRFPDSVDIKQRAYEQRRPQVEMEQETLQTDHAVVGYLVSNRWALPKHISQIIRRHHDAAAFIDESDTGTGTGAGTYMAILKLAEHIDSRFWGRNDDPEWDRCREAVLVCLDIDDDDVEDIAEDMLDLLIACK